MPLRRKRKDHRLDAWDRCLWGLLWLLAAWPGVSLALVAVVGQQ